MHIFERRVGLVAGLLLVVATSTALAGCGETDEDNEDEPDDESSPMLFASWEGERELEWSVPMEGPYATLAAELDDQRVVVGDWGGRLVAVDRQGAVDWEAETGEPVRAAPTVDDGAVFAGDRGGTVYRFDTDGEQIWETEVGDRVDHSPAVDGDGHLWTTGGDGSLRRLDREDGTVLETVELGRAATTAPTVRTESDGTQRVFVGTADSELHCLDVGDSGSAEVVETPGNPSVEVSIADDGRPVLGTADGVLVKLDDDCAIDWSVDVTWATLSGVSVGPDGELYVGGRNRVVYAYPADGSDRQWATEIGTHAPIPNGPVVTAEGGVVVGANGLVTFDTEGTRHIETRLDIVHAPLPAGDRVVVGLDRGPVAGFPYDFEIAESARWPVQHADAGRTGRIELD